MQITIFYMYFTEILKSTINKLKIVVFLMLLLYHLAILDFIIHDNTTVIVKLTMDMRLLCVVSLNGQKRFVYA